MIVKILRTNSYSTATVQEGKIHLDTASLEECVYQPSIRQALSWSETKSLTEQVSEGEKFFVAISPPDTELGGRAVGSYVAHIEGKTLILEDKLHGTDSFSLADGMKLLAIAHQPTNLSFLDNYDGAVMTSDGMVTLEEDDFIYHNGDNIGVISLTDLLIKFGKATVDQSPNYKRLNLSAEKKKPKRPRNGTVFYNDVSKCIEFYADGSWKRVKTEDEE